MCPPSSGSSGNRLNTPMKKFNDASRNRNEQPGACCHGLAADPAAPTTLIGLFGSRFWPCQCADRGRDLAPGTLPIAPKVASSTVPVKRAVAAEGAARP